MKTSNKILSITGLLVIIATIYGAVNDNNTVDKVDIEKISADSFSSVTTESFSNVIVTGNAIISINKKSNQSVKYFSKNSEITPEFKVNEDTLFVNIKQDNNSNKVAFIKITAPLLTLVDLNNIEKCEIFDFKQDSLYINCKKSKVKLNNINCMYLNINTKDTSKIRIKNSIINNLNINSKNSSHTNFTDCNIKQLNGKITGNSTVRSSKKLFTIAATIDSTSSLYKY